MNIIRKYRQDQKMTQIELAGLLGVSQAQVAHVEKGRRQFSPAVAFKLEKISNGELTLREILPTIFGEAG